MTEQTLPSLAEMKEEAKLAIDLDEVGASYAPWIIGLVEKLQRYEGRLDAVQADAERRRAVGDASGVDWVSDVASGQLVLIQELRSELAL